MKICKHNKRQTICKECHGGHICVHNKKRSCCRFCAPQNFCKHDKRKGVCIECGLGSICEHKKQRYTCRICGRNAVCNHGRSRRACRECFPRSWAVRVLSKTATDARRKGYATVKISPEELLSFIDNSPLCCGCEGFLDYKTKGFYAPCLHHNHKTGEFIGFAHRECNALEGQLQKLGSRLPIFIKNFFPYLAKETGEQ
jgi:hypothetical protein